MERGHSRTVNVRNLPANSTVRGLVKFLEGIVGDGNVYLCKIKPPKSASTCTCATVQLEASYMARNLCLTELSMPLFNGSRLKFGILPRDLMPKPRAAPLKFAQGKLYFGCLVSQNEYCVLWSSTKLVNVEVEKDKKKLFIYLNERGVEFKLMLLFRDIRFVHRRSNTSGKKYLVFQLRYAPKIYYLKEPDQIMDNAQLFDYYKVGNDIPWIRTTDFTRDFSVASSSSICLEVLGGIKNDEVDNIFFYYKDIKEDFCLKRGVSSLCVSTSRLVPIVSPPVGINIPYRVLFQVNILVQEGILSWPALSREFFSLLQPNKDRPIDKIISSLNNLRFSGICYNPEKELSKKLSRSNSKRAVAFRVHEGLMNVHRVHVTPLKIYFYGPEIDESNRVTRQFSECTDDFLRVTFVDEDGSKLYATDLCPRLTNGSKRHTKLYKRVLSVLKEGIVIGNKRFEFLAFSASQLRESSVWMFASNDKDTAQSIRQWMGDFMSIRNVAKCAARMGQSFSSSKETLHVHEHEVKQIPDIEKVSGSNKYVFSDGIGKISQQLAKKVASKCGCDGVPSAFQIRYCGYKGVVAVDPTCADKLSFRPSMRKFDSRNTYLDVLSWSKFRPCFLNRQIITLLSTLGVADRNFEILQQRIVKRLDQLLQSRETAIEELQLMSAGEHRDVLARMLQCGYSPKSEPYLSMVLHAFRASKLVDLKKKTRIFVSKGRCLMGCLDETGTLNYGEVFVQVSRPKVPNFNENNGFNFGLHSLRSRPEIIKSKVIIAKNPCLHPGDVRILQAVDNPRLHHLVDCLVFPQQGERPHSHECSGSDLDGDLYFISWEESLLPPQQDRPMEYSAPPMALLDHDVTIEEIQEFFAKFMLNDALGIISSRHVVFADLDHVKARSQKCLELAKLFSVAVDFPKTGVPAEVPGNLVPKEYPDFMEKEDKPSYMSHQIIGKLYRSVKDPAMNSLSISSFTREVARQAYDRDLEVDGFEDYLDEALRCKTWYDSSLAMLMHMYGIKYEAEIVSGNIFSMSKFHGYKPGDLREMIMTEVRSLQKEARTWFKSEKVAWEADEYELASAWYHVTYHPDYWGSVEYEGRDRFNSHFISFPWVIYDRLLTIKRRKRLQAYVAADPAEGSRTIANLRLF